MADMYETKISDKRWWAYDLPGNIGWIAYIASLARIFVKRPALLGHSALFWIAVAAVIPACMMLAGIAELIGERILKLGRVLPKRRLHRGFGMLTWGGCAGSAVGLAGLLIGFGSAQRGLAPLWILFLGGAFCAVFAGLILRSFHPQRS